MSVKRAHEQAFRPSFASRTLADALETCFGGSIADPFRIRAEWLRHGRCIIEILRVSGTSRPNAVAGAIAAILRNDGEVEVQAIGANAVNQAVKAIAVARSYIEPDELDLTTVPSFVKLELQEEERTAVRFSVTCFPLRPAE